MKGYESIYIAPPPPPSLTFECEGPRLIITHIENENFKSYQGKRTLGPFHKSFTSIVGPNGSGKSNVIDSMLFVFGYRANKIRLKKISHLIHNSENFPDLRTCKVRVFFQVINWLCMQLPGPTNNLPCITTAFKNLKKCNFKFVFWYLHDYNNSISKGKINTFEISLSLCCPLL